MNKTYRNMIIYVVMVYLLTTVLSIVSNHFSLDQTPVTTIIMAIAYLIPAGVAFFLLKKERPKASPQALIGLKKEGLLPYGLCVVFVLLHFGCNGLFGNIKTYGGFLQLLPEIPYALVFGGLAEIGWRRYLQPKLFRALGYADLWFVLIFLTLIVVCWYIPVYSVPWCRPFGMNWFLILLLLTGNTFMLAAIRMSSKGAIPCILAQTLFMGVNQVWMVSNHWLAVAFISILEVAASFGCMVYIFTNKKKKKTMKEPEIKTDISI